MTFTVTYRGADGAMSDERVEAANRAECFAQCRARGIAPLSVKEGDSASRRGAETRRGETDGNGMFSRRGHKDNGGKNGRAAASAKAMAAKERAGGRGRVVACVLSAALVALIGGGVWWWMNGSTGTENPEPTQAPRRTGALAKEVKPAKAAEPLPEPVATGSEPVPKRESLRDPGLSAEKQEEMYEKKLVETPIAEASTNRLFRTALEQVMGWVFTTQLGDMPPPLPPIPDYDLVHLEEILNLKNTVQDTDTDRQANEKDIVDYVKKELKKFIDKGGDPEDFLKYYHDELKSAYAERSMAQERVMKIMQEDPAVAMEYMKEVNESLAAKGIKGVVLPERTLMRMGIDPKLLKGDSNQ